VAEVGPRAPWPLCDAAGGTGPNREQSSALGEPRTPRSRNTRSRRRAWSIHRTDRRPVRPATAAFRKDSLPLPFSRCLRRPTSAGAGPGLGGGSMPPGPGSPASARRSIYLLGPEGAGQGLTAPWGVDSSLCFPGCPRPNAKSGPWRPCTTASGGVNRHDGRQGIRPTSRLWPPWRRARQVVSLRTWTIRYGLAGSAMGWPAPLWPPASGGPGSTRGGHRPCG
jgi:hypothetical protein